jgi:hypothetical protein
MTLMKTVAVPPDRRVLLDLTLPETFTPGSRLRLEASTNADWKESFPLKPGEQARTLYGLFESDGHEVDRFLAEKRREKAREDAADRSATVRFLWIR